MNGILLESIKDLFEFDATTWSAVYVSVKVSAAALSLATPLGVGLGVMLTLYRFRGRRAVLSIIRGLLSFPTVVVGLCLYLALSRSGPLGAWNLLFTPAAMALGQFIIAIPVVTTLTASAAGSLDVRAIETAKSLGVRSTALMWTTVREIQPLLVGVIASAFGRVFSEVGCSLMVGGNIAGSTRNIPTAIALQTGRGDYALGISLGIVLVIVALLINTLAGLFPADKWANQHEVDV